jgi:uncharacterized delta-60 repeat protein
MRRLLLTLLPFTLLIAGTQNAGARAGALDPTFSDDGIATAFATGSVANAVAIDHAGRSVVVGEAIGDHVVVAVARFRPDGTPDPSFGGGDGRVKMSLGGDVAAAFDVAVASHDGLAIVGRRTRGTTEDSFVLRLDADGEPVAAFGGDGLTLVDFGKEESANAVSFTASGGIAIAGYVSNGTAVRSALARLGPDGRLDPTFSGNGKKLVDLSPGADELNDLVVLPNDAIVAAGYADFATQPRFDLTKLNRNGKLALGFGHQGVVRTDVSPGADIANAIALTGSGGFVLAGSASNDGRGDWGVARYLADGSLDPGFSSDGLRILGWSAAAESAEDVQLDGRRIVLAGRIHPKGAGDDAGVVRLRAAGRLDDTYGDGGVALVDVAGRTDAARGVAIQENGKVVLAGETWSKGTPRFLVARLRAG